MAYLQDRVLDAWSKLHVTYKQQPKTEFKKFTKEEFNELKDAYHKEFGYTIRIPTVDDIIHIKPNFMKTPEELKLEKRLNLLKLMDSPSPEWLKEYSTVMTMIDDVQDTVSVAYPLMKLFSKVAPKAFKKLIPVFGTVLTAYDILNFANSLLRLTRPKMDVKRHSCKYFWHNPFTKQGRMRAAHDITHWKPSWGDFIQMAQVLDTFTGAGLALGSIVGAVMDTFTGAYRYASGEKVKFSFEPPPESNFTFISKRGALAAAAISSQGQTFTDHLHFWTYQTAALSSLLVTQDFHDYGMVDMIENLMDVMIPAPEPRDPITIEVIKAQGLKVDSGIGWPFNGEKFISLGDLSDAIAEPARANFVNYCIRHKNDWYGYQAAAAMETVIFQNTLAVDTTSEWDLDDTEEMKVFWKMVKAPLIHKELMSESQSADFWSRIRAYKDQVGKLPGIMYIQGILEDMGVPYETSYPTERPADYAKFWPEDIDFSEVLEE